MQKSLLNKLRDLKPELQSKGFELIGVFGSYARDEETSNSDIDLLYQINDIDSYLEKYKGWDSILHIVETKDFLKKELHKDIDFVDKATLNDIGQEYILKDLVYV
jgi:predicted nucleotidyltransferase